MDIYYQLLPAIIVLWMSVLAILVVWTIKSASTNGRTTRRMGTGRVLEDHESEVTAGRGALRVWKSRLT
jgi:hypothetical protein